MTRLLPLLLALSLGACSIADRQQQAMDDAVNNAYELCNMGLKLSEAHAFGFSKDKSVYVRFDFDCKKSSISDSWVPVSNASQGQGWGR